MAGRTDATVAINDKEPGILSPALLCFMPSVPSLKLLSKMLLSS